MLGASMQRECVFVNLLRLKVNDVNINYEFVGMS